MNDEEGFFQKYRVERVDGKPLKGGCCIVLELGDDLAMPALRLYASTLASAGKSAFARDVTELLERQERVRQGEGYEQPWRQKLGAWRNSYGACVSREQFERRYPNSPFWELEALEALRRFVVFDERKEVVVPQSVMKRLFALWAYTYIARREGSGYRLTADDSKQHNTFVTREQMLSAIAEAGNRLCAEEGAADGD